VREVVEQLSEAATDAGCEVRVRIDRPDLAGEWDRFRVAQIVTNLVSNAIKYGARRPVSIMLEPIHAERNVRITVSDGGPGIAPEHRALLFERFARFAPKRNYAGFGLGLWITREFVRAHGGIIELRSEPGPGATFVVELPVVPPHRATAGFRERAGRSEEGVVQDKS
jgi:signal transduction histidine kinase